MATNLGAKIMTTRQADDDNFQLGGGGDRDLSYWEFVNNSDADYSEDCFSLDSFSDDVISCDSFSLSSPREIDEVQILPHDFRFDVRPGRDHGDDLVNGSRKSPVEEEGYGAHKLAFRNRAADGNLEARDGDSLYYALVRYAGARGRCDRDEIYGDDQGDDDAGDNYRHDDDQDDEDDACDMDDELVPRWASGKLGRQRMRKLSKRAFSKISSSKRLPYSHVKPGCLYGKHGYGINYRS